ncbi:NAD(P)H-dependent oxidoreductase [Porifericola rhodea]|uniref:NAD(P)H-dependent oxidoreductase n=1 Tax=Porifericola rhodea TaxID=930972 RepID=UPI00266652AC|nr:NAD(P)H-dependent oxidoreductase [Porifericola rhodea]WKN31222.1 NAD(P)H-dependent oxidoreductase [Porifericola rhodea]
MELIENLKWRYATKKFDPNKKISSADIEIIKEAVQLSVSSYGLQLYKVLFVEDKALREQLKPASWGQGQITDASHLVVFCNYTNIQDEQIDDFVKLVADTRQQKVEDLQGYGDFVKSKLAEKSDAEKANWTARQTYLALGNLLTACAELKIDACPMEGFESETYNEILGLKERGLNAAVVATIGYRAEDDSSQQAAKVRRPVEELFEVI